MVQRNGSRKSSEPPEWLAGCFFIGVVALTGLASLALLGVGIWALIRVVLHFT